MNNAFLTMTGALQEAVAEFVYEKVRGRFVSINPQIRPWAAFTPEEKEECKLGIQLWLRGLGANEITEEWYNRSGHVPPALWSQTKGYAEDFQPFALAGLDMLDLIVRLANETMDMREHARGMGRSYGYALYDETPVLNDMAVNDRACYDYIRRNLPLPLQIHYQAGAVEGYHLAKNQDQ